MEIYGVVQSSHADRASLSATLDKDDMAAGFCLARENKSAIFTVIKVSDS